MELSKMWMSVRKQLQAYLRQVQVPASGCHVPKSSHLREEPVPAVSCRKLINWKESRGRERGGRSGMDRILFAG